MLARANRLVSGDEFRRVTRRGRRVEFEHLVVTSLETDGGSPARFGFTLTKKVGNAVERNRLRRRLRAIAWELVREGAKGRDVVVRGLPSAVTADWDSLHTELTTAIRKDGTTAK